MHAMSQRCTSVMYRCMPVSVHQANHSTLHGSRRYSNIPRERKTGWNRHPKWCERCYKKFFNNSDIYVKQTDDGDTLYCLKCQEEIICTEAEFQRLVKVYNIDLAKIHV